MCGIAALFSVGPRPLGELARAMAEVARHRGPDDAGVWEGEGAALGHRRLSIVDLTPAGHQPMATPDRRYWITYNGEVYNHIELRAELERLGDTFASHCDTEVLLLAYRRWGRRCLERLNGMFAFVIVDTVARRVFAARDRFGVKPLYVWRSPDGLTAFASEIKQLTVLPGWRARLAPEQAGDFLEGGVFDHGRGTLFSGVEQLRGGEYVEQAIDDVARGVAPARWYELAPRPFAGGLEEAGAELRRLLTDSVRLRLRADVPVGSCLSGGLDSSSIVCLANQLLAETPGHPRQMTFSARAESPSADESTFAEEVIRATGVDGRFILPAGAALFDLLPQLTWHQDEPFASTSIYAQWRVFELAAAHGVKVMLDGQGADEVLCGYHDFFPVRFASLLRSLRLIDLWRDVRATRRLHKTPLLRAATHTVGHLLPEAARRPLGAGPSGTVAEVSRARILDVGLPMLLHYEDRSSMAHSIESRVPFLDYRLVELALGLPDDLKLARGVTKRVLREGMRGVLPERIRQRTDKLGFATPEEAWLREREPDAFRRALQRAIEQSRGVLSPGAMDVLERTIAGQRAFDFRPWRMISFGAWMDRFAVSP